MHRADRKKHSTVLLKTACPKALNVTLAPVASKILPCRSKYVPSKPVCRSRGDLWPQDLRNVLAGEPVSGGSGVWPEGQGEVTQALLCALDSLKVHLQ